MKRRYFFGAIITAVSLLLFAWSFAADRSQTERDSQVKKSAAADVASTPQNNSAQIRSGGITETKERSTGNSLVTPAQPQATVVMDWYTFSCGGGRQVSTSFDMNSTVGQTAAGEASSASYRINAGFQQNFSTSCCLGTTGNINMTGIVDLSDLSALVNYLTGGGYAITCIPEANINNTGIVDLSDLSALVSYLTGGGFVLPNCP